MRILKHVFTMLLLLSVTTASAHDFEVGGIYYNILSEEDKTVEVTFKGNYSNSYEAYTGSVVIPEMVTKPASTSITVLKTYDAWTSTNKGSGGTTSQKSYTLNVAAGNILKFDWSVSSESNYDWLTITLDGTEIVRKSGTLSGSYEKTFDTAGTHTLVVKYTKDSSSNYGDDEGEIYNIALGIAKDDTVSLVYRVASIGNDAFFGCSSLVSVVIPNGVTTIGGYAFNDCTGLTSVVIPNSVTSIGDYAFDYCSGLTSITIPNSVTSIGSCMFRNCTGLTSITIPNSVTSIGYCAFQSCTRLTSITIPNSVTSIGSFAFTDCTGLTSITIPNSVTSIGSSAFSGCTGLTSITIPNSVTSIDGCAFEGCTGLTSITIPNSVTSIGNSAFKGTAWYNNQPDGVVYAGKVLYEYKGTMPLNTSVTVKDGTLGIAGSAFRDCTGLTSITIPNSVTNIEYYAFYGCTGLTSITIPNSVTSIGSCMFRNCTGLTSITIPNSVTSIGYCAFQSCTRLTSITIPNSVTSIGSNAFSYCYGLKEVHISDLSAWCNIAFENTDANPLYYARNLYLNGELVTDLVIPNSVTSIGSSAFYWFSGLTSIVIGNSVTSIGSSAFYWCDGLTSIVIGNSVTSIGESAFYNCDGLTSIEIPNSVTSIGEKAFRSCDNLASIVIGNSVTSIGESAFYGCTGLTSVTSLIPADELFTIDSDVFYNVNKTSCTLYVPYGEKETYAATEGWNEFTNIVELEPVTEVTVTINQYGNATFCSEFALDFNNVEGLKAYAATGYKTNSQVVTLTRVQTAEAGIGLFLKGEPGEYVVPVIESTDEHSLNMLVGVLEETVVNSTDGAMSNYKFIISDVDNAPMFCPFENNSTFSAGEAYLQVPTAWLSSTVQKSLSIRFDEGEFTDIDEVEGENGEVKTVYDLLGRVVENPTNGIYIIDGKKVLVK